MRISVSVDQQSSSSQGRLDAAVLTVTCFWLRRLWWMGTYSFLLHHSWPASVQCAPWKTVEWTPISKTHTEDWTTTHSEGMDSDGRNSQPSFRERRKGQSDAYSTSTCSAYKAATSATLAEVHTATSGSSTLFGVHVPEVFGLLIPFAVSRITMALHQQFFFCLFCYQVSVSCVAVLAADWTRTRLLPLLRSNMNHRRFPYRIIINPFN